MAATTKNAKTMDTWKKIDELTTEVERHMAELRTLPRTRRYAARRAQTQRRCVELGEEMRRLLGMRVE